MRPPRLKLRTLIVLVALATLAVGGVEYWRRAAKYRALAEREAALEKSDLARAKKSRAIVASTPESQRKLVDGIPLEMLIFESNAINREFSANEHARRRAAYLRCARYPWLTPPADEPDPKTEEPTPPPELPPELEPK